MIRQVGVSENSLLATRFRYSERVLFFALGHWDNIRQCVVLWRDGARMHGLVGWCMESTEGVRVACSPSPRRAGCPSRSAEVETAQRSAWAVCDSERKEETRKGSVVDCGFRNKRTVFCGMVSMPLKNRPAYTLNKLNTYLYFGINFRFFRFFGFFILYKLLFCNSINLGGAAFRYNHYFFYMYSKFHYRNKE